MSGLTSQLNKLGLGSGAKAAAAAQSQSQSSTSTATSTAPAPVQSSLTAALAASGGRPRHKKSISGGQHDFDINRLSATSTGPVAPGSTGSQTRTLQASKRQQSSTNSNSNSNSKPILISSKPKGKTGREGGGPTLAQSAPTVHYVPPPAPSARPRIASFDPPPMALPPSPDTRGPLASVLRHSISKGPSSRANKHKDAAAAAQARQQRSLSMYPSSAPAHNINYMEQLAAAAAVGVFPHGGTGAGKKPVFEEGEEEDEEDRVVAATRAQHRQAAEDHSETSSTTSSHRSEHKSDEKSGSEAIDESLDSTEDAFDSEDSDVEYSVDGEEEVITRPIERRMSDLSSSLTYTSTQADVGMLSKSPTIFSILKQDGTPTGGMGVLGMLSSSASSTGSSHLSGVAARVGLPPLAGKKSASSATSTATSTSTSSSTRGIQISSGAKKAANKKKHGGAYGMGMGMGSPTDDLQFSISLDPNEDSILDQELEEEEEGAGGEPIRENEFMGNY